MNKADPRVDSDRDYSRNMGANPDRSADIGRSTAATTGTHTGQHTTLGSNTGTHGTTGYDAPEGTYGQHNSRLANAADPRIDSDRDHRGAPGHTGTTGLGGTTGHGGTTGFGGTTGLGGTTGHRGTTGIGGTSTGYSGPGPAPNTAGPHGSDMLNKADPRVDSDLDGSKTFGGNKTYGS